MIPPHQLTIAALREAYAAGSCRPTDVVREVFERIAAASDNPAWIHLREREHAIESARVLEDHADARQLPLYGIPLAIKDNIDVAGLPTTAGCPAYRYTAERTATTVQRLLDAGALLIGKTNMDQFATGLVGTRSPYGACHSVYDTRYISGGSSSGSAVAVAAGMASVSLGTDTAGSGRVPAAFNNLVGLKPTRGALSAADVVPACRSLDCVSIFAHSCQDAELAFLAARGFDPRDAYSRTWSDRPSPWLASTPRVGIPAAGQLEFFGDDAAAQLFEQARGRFAAMGCEVIETDWTPFREAAKLLYSGPWVAERLAAIEAFLRERSAMMDPTVAGIIRGASRLSAVDAFRGMDRLQELRRESDRCWQDIDVLVLPTTGTTYTIDAVNADPVKLNSNLGYYTNFVNLLDLAAVAIPAGFRENGLPFGITLMAPAFSDVALLRLGARFGGSAEADAQGAGCITVAVVGAHLTGQPLNHQLTSRGSRLVRTTRTARDYRLYALANTTPRKPGLVREPGFEGPGIEVELWSVPESEFGSFVAAIPPPLGIGKIGLEGGELVCGFLCEPQGLRGATEITALGSWRRWLSDRLP